MPCDASRRGDGTDGGAMIGYGARLLVSTLALCAVSSVAWAQLYRWVDANGVTQYSDKPPAGDRSKFTVIAPPPAVASDGAARKESDWQAQDLEFKQRQVERAEAKRKQDKENEAKKQNADARRQACLDARDQINNLQGGVRIFRWNDQGQKVYMDDSERPAELSKAEQMAANNCSS